MFNKNKEKYCKSKITFEKCVTSSDINNEIVTDSEVLSQLIELQKKYDFDIINFDMGCKIYECMQFIIYCKKSEKYEIARAFISALDSKIEKVCIK